MESKVKKISKKKLSDMVDRRRPMLGGDPEFFITTKRGKILSACQFLPSKFNKKGVMSHGRSLGKFFFDGVQGEMNIAPSACRETLTIRIWKVLNSIKKSIGEDYKLVMKPSVVVSRAVLDRADPEAKRFGCSPDWNAYTGLQNESKLNGDTHRVRYGGGHIHIGFGKKDRMLDDPDLFLKFVILLDLILGIPMLLLDVGPAGDRRRKYYGKAGTFRETRWGVEYRQPSNIWLKSPELTSLALGLTRTAYRIMVSAVDNKLWDMVEPEEVQLVIDSSDRKGCVEIYERIKPLLISASHPDDPFYNRHQVEGKTGALFYVSGTKLYEYVMEQTVDSVYGNDCEKTWSMDPKTTWCPDKVTSGFIEGTIGKVCGGNKDDIKKFAA